jgi:hypothetical protein
VFDGRLGWEMDGRQYLRNVDEWCDDGYQLSTYSEVALGQRITEQPCVGEFSIDDPREPITAER